MSTIEKLQLHLPKDALRYLHRWFGDFNIHIKITKNRTSKLGDYRKKRDQSHEITINSTLVPDLFFFVLTHELAHLLAFEKFGRTIVPHGREWKATFSEMLLESLTIYPEDLQLILKKFSINPKANFMTSSDLVRYFHIDDLREDEDFIESLDINNYFRYKGEVYQIIEKRKKLYLCVQTENNKKYLFKPLARIQKL